jgi:predicted O-methyltransferase YrrM
MSLNDRKVSNEVFIRELMTHFFADEAGHRANIDVADMGYGWIHYGLVRLIKPTRILCIGSGYGYIPGLLAQACLENGHGHVDFVDAGYGIRRRHNFEWVGFWKTIEGQMVFRDFGLNNYITLHLMRTDEYIKKFPELRYQYVYIDGDHLYKGIKYDFDIFWPRLDKNGFLALHDISIKEAQPEGKYWVWRLWEQIGTKNGIEFVHPRSGLGIVQKK